MWGMDFVLIDLDLLGNNIKGGGWYLIISSSLISPYNELYCKKVKDIILGSKPIKNPNKEGFIFFINIDYRL